MTLSFRFLILLMVCSLTGVSANEVRNGDFSEEARFWFVLVNGGFRDSGVMAPFMRTSGEGLNMLVDEIPGDKDQPAAVVLNQRVQTLQPGGAYVLRFELRGNRNESILAGLGKPVTYGEHRGNLSGGIPVRVLELTPDWTPVEIPFVYNADHSLTLPGDARETLLQFRVGRVTNFHLRGVSITEK
ncbi:MAG: hypothetical protein JJU05_02005 [Verrucomicrobia bacterium]|nr:hypothetical protein [Verrucomicrobiota bacterium]MCH8526183.1 hypothetical protein [Kiritimatiellia bacterium]